MPSPVAIFPFMTLGQYRELEESLPSSKRYTERCLVYFHGRQCALTKGHFGLHCIEVFEPEPAKGDE